MHHAARGYQTRTASFLYPQGTQKALRGSNVCETIVNKGL